MSIEIEINKNNLIPNLLRKSMNLDYEIYQKLSGLYLFSFINKKNKFGKEINKKIESGIKKDYSEYLLHENEEFESLFFKYEKLFSFFEIINEERKIFRDIIRKMLNNKFWQLEKKNDESFYNKIKGLNIEILKKKINDLEEKVLRINIKKNMISKQNLELKSDLKKNKGYLKRLLNLDSHLSNPLKEENRKKSKTKPSIKNNFSEFKGSINSNHNSKPKKFRSCLHNLLEKEDKSETENHNNCNSKPKKFRSHLNNLLEKEDKSETENHNNCNSKPKKFRSHLNNLLEKEDKNGSKINNKKIKKKNSLNKNILKKNRKKNMMIINSSNNSTRFKSTKKTINNSRRFAITYTSNLIEEKKFSKKKNNWSTKSITYASNLIEEKKISKKKNNWSTKNLNKKSSGKKLLRKNNSSSQITSKITNKKIINFKMKEKNKKIVIQNFQDYGFLSNINIRKISDL